MANNFNIVRPNDDESNTNEFFSYFREGNVFLVQREIQNNFDFSNNYTKSYEYVLVYIDENQNVAKNKLAFYPSLLVKKDSSTYEGYLNVIQADQINCHIITATSDILSKLALLGHDLETYSLETVKMFRRDALASSFSI